MTWLSLLMIAGFIFTLIMGCRAFNRYRKTKARRLPRDGGDW